jgi:hypothetical protein
VTVRAPATRVAACNRPLPTPLTLLTLFGEDFLYDFKGGSLRSPPAAPPRAAGARKLASSPARAASHHQPRS